MWRSGGFGFLSAGFAPGIAPPPSDFWERASGRRIEAPAAASGVGGPTEDLPGDRKLLVVVDSMIVVGVLMALASVGMLLFPFWVSR